jgi:cation transport ATPase
MAVAADTGTSLLVILNGMRLIAVKDKTRRDHFKEAGALSAG